MTKPGISIAGDRDGMPWSTAQANPHLSDPDRRSRPWEPVVEMAKRDNRDWPLREAKLVRSQIASVSGARFHHGHPGLCQGRREARFTFIA